MSTAEAVEIPLWRHPAFRWMLVISGVVVLGQTFWWEPLKPILSELEFAIAELLPESRFLGVSALTLPPMAFAAGALASLSPCILPLVPLNVAYIGASESTGWRSVSLSARFVLGAVLVLTSLGIFGDLAGFLLIDQRGPLLLLVGISLVYFGFVALEVAPMPFDGRSGSGMSKLGPVGAGAAFSLVATPCASPLMAAVLAASTTQSQIGLGIISMASFSLGYTLLVFLGGVFGGGLAMRARQFSFAAPRAAAAALLLVAGMGCITAGAIWF
jgi:cytochrome c-type biogenesis protein